MKARFEEKTYENYFNAELNNRSEVFFPLGQIQEGFLGFDSSAQSRDEKLWNNLAFPFWFFPYHPGVRLREIANEIEEYLGVVLDNIPQMKANLLFQYKRPEYISISLGKEWEYWKQPYFRYDIYQKQFNLLDQINSKFSSKILITYASPAVWKVDDLVDLKIEGKIIDTSNFKRVTELNGHERNTYIKSGTYSIACSEPTRSDNLNLLSELEELENLEVKKGINNRQFIIRFANRISTLIRENPNYNDSFDKLTENFLEYSQYELLNSFFKMSVFKDLTGIQWIVKL